jgi:hypothetical protein
MDHLNHLGNDYVDLLSTDISIGLKVYYRKHVSKKGITYNEHTIKKINPDRTYNTQTITKQTDNSVFPGFHSIVTRNNVRLCNLKQKVIHILPSLLFIAKGVHDEMYKDSTCTCNAIIINIPIFIIGESREHCIVMVVRRYMYV